MTAQLKEIEFAHRFKFSNKPLQELARMVAETTPEGIDKTLFLSGGSEATEAAIKIARAYFVEIGKPSKYKVLSRRMSYHGNTLGALSLSGHMDRRRKFAPMLLDVQHVAPANCYHCPFEKRPETCTLECARDFETAILHHGPENIMAIIVEPISGAGLGTVIPHDSYMKKLREICDKYEVLMIADEVMTGMGRTGRTWAMNHWDVVPDMITMAKGLSGGYAPIGAVSVKNYIYEAFQKGKGNFTHGHTYGSHPVCMAAGIAVLNYIQKKNLISNSAKMGDYLISQLNQIAEVYPQIGQVRGKGLMTGVEFILDKSTRAPFDPKLDITGKVTEMAFKEGLMLYGAPKCIDGSKGDAVMVAPPLTVTKEEVDLIIDMFSTVLNKVFSKL
jgi:adenosylmethionine-8-amino-7-oxononanoate aminotransferase